MADKRHTLALLTTGVRGPEDTRNLSKEVGKVHRKVESIESLNDLPENVCSISSQGNMAYLQASIAPVALGRLPSYLQHVVHLASEATNSIDQSIFRMCDTRGSRQLQLRHPGQIMTGSSKQRTHILVNAVRTSSRSPIHKLKDRQACRAASRWTGSPIMAARGTSAEIAAPPMHLQVA